MSNTPPKYKKVISLVVFVISLGISFGIFFIPVNTQELATFGYLGVFIVTLLGAATMFIPGPTMVAAFLAGKALNPLLVTIVAGLGSAIGESTGYVAGYSTRDIFADTPDDSKWYVRVQNWMRSNAFLTLFIVAAIPNFLTDVSGVISGRINYPYHKFLAATFIGKAIRFGVSAYLGAWFFST